MKAIAATVCAVGIAAGVLALLVLQRWVAEIDDGKRK